MQKIISTLFLTLLTVFVFAQEPFYKSYTWDENPIKDITTNSDEEIICFKDKIVTEFIYDSENKLTEYFLIHKIYWLNSDDIIESYNKVYLPYSSQSKLVVNKARVISKDGKIIELDDSKILTAKDEETKREYKYYAFEGLEKGSFIEYYYVLNRSPDFDGKRLNFQTNHNKYNIDFELFAPKNLWFKFKSYNQLNEVIYDSTFTEKIRWNLHMDSLPLLENESQSPYDALVGYLVYNLYYNSTTKTYDISSYKNISQNMYDFYYASIESKSAKNINKIIGELKLKNEKDETNKIRKIEDFIKENYHVVNGGGPEFRELSFVLDKKIGSNQGIMRLYIAIFEALEIQHEIVITCDRSDNKFDKDFESYNFLDEYLLYFPKIKKYISPFEITSRLGFPEPLLTNNYGLFIKQIQMGEFKTGVGKIKFIEPVSHTETYSKIFTTVTFDKDDLTKTTLDMVLETGGYYSMNYQTIIHLLKEQDKEDLINEQIKFISQEMTIVSKKLENDNPKSFGYKPYKITAQVTSEDFVEKAGDKYLFKVGELIGPQQEMYQDNDRKLVLENDFKRSYHRELTVSIPDGYTITNLEKINIQNVYKEDGEIFFEFHSHYKMDGNTLTIICDEYYTVVEIPSTIFEEYRKVINSAADFNKLTLVLAK
ncbi:MAG: hypothetical protein CO022_07765 [Flavobacteriales bacterium CG_4_9_14_0_2_um_filter_32_27]|nr:MAG: hypothetical protein CO022_07765 [Flavobacteriales bacterium CG_4_9_14_0_2_um_filter_32_27]